MIFLVRFFCEGFSYPPLPVLCALYGSLLPYVVVGSHGYLGFHWLRGPLAAYVALCWPELLPPGSLLASLSTNMLDR